MKKFLMMAALVAVMLVHGQARAQESLYLDCSLATPMGDQAINPVHCNVQLDDGVFVYIYGANGQDDYASCLAQPNGYANIPGIDISWECVGNSCLGTSLIWTTSELRYCYFGGSMAGCVPQQSTSFSIAASMFCV